VLVDEHVVGGGTPPNNTGLMQRSQAGADLICPPLLHISGGIATHGKDERLALLNGMEQVPDKLVLLVANDAVDPAGADLGLELGRCDLLVHREVPLEQFRVRAQALEEGQFLLTDADP